MIKTEKQIKRLKKVFDSMGLPSEIRQIPFTNNDVPKFLKKLMDFEQASRKHAITVR